MYMRHVAAVRPMLWEEACIAWGGGNTILNQATILQHPYYSTHTAGRDVCNLTFHVVWQVNVYDTSSQKLAVNMSVIEPKSKGIF